MFSRLRENFHYKFLALVCAAIIHFYVVGQVNPHQSRSFTVLLSSVNLPQGLLIDEKTLPSVTVTLDGPTDEINHLTESNVAAVCDLTNAHSGRNAGEHVRIELPPDIKNDMTVDFQPHTASIFLKPQRKKHLPVTATYPGTPPAGYAYRAPVVTPKEAIIAGDDDSVNAVSQLVIKIGGGGSAGTVDDDFTVVPLDSDGNEVSNVIVSPATVHVRIGIIKVPAMRSLIVSPTVVGAIPFPYKIADVEVTPSSVIASGRPDRLAAIGTINTVPLNISGATADVTRDVALAPVDGVVVSKPVTVKVLVHIVTEQPSTVPATGAVPVAPQR